MTNTDQTMTDPGLADDTAAADQESSPVDPESVTDTVDATPEADGSAEPVSADDAEDDGDDEDEDDDNPLEVEAEVAADYLEELLDIADLDGDIDTYIDGDRAHVSIVSESNALVGKDGQVLDALQELTRLAVLAETGQRSRLMLDVAGYRGKRRTELVASGRRRRAGGQGLVRAGAPEGDEPVRAQDRPRRRGCGRADERVGGRRASSTRGRPAGAWLSRPEPSSSPGAADHESAAPGDVSEQVVQQIYGSGDVFRLDKSI